MGMAKRAEPFNDLGASHNVDEEYRQTRKITAFHYSKFNMLVFPEDQFIRIVFDLNSDKFLLIGLTNIIYRADDVGFEKQISTFPDEVRNDPVALRNSWYSKFNERELYVHDFEEFKPVTNPLVEFPYYAFYSFPEFCKSLNKVAEFLGRKLLLDESLYHLWAKFIDKNQGWQSYIKCTTILNNIFSNADYNFSCSPIEQGWINFNLSKIYDIYSGTMFDHPEYPSNTRNIYNELQNHLHRKS